MDWFLGVIRGLFAAIDKVVVWLIDNLYNLIFEISSVQIFDNTTLAAFSNRITVILSIFMIFKLSLSFLNYIVNPDAMTDKSKGFSKLIQNIAIALVLLVSYQFLFDKAMELQQKIVDNNTIPKLILGPSGKNIKNSSIVSFQLFASFIVPESNLLETQPECRTYFISDGTAPHSRCNIKDYSENAASMPSVGNDPNEQLDYTVTTQNTYHLFDYLLRLKKNGIFAFDYKIIISTICGAFAALMFLSFCMDVAVRIIKLYFLRLIAPIPIISYVDPIKGEGIFKKWLSTAGKTYADLFIRVTAIFFAIFIIQQIPVNAGSLKDFNGNPIENPFVIIFIIIGALMFAKQFPKLIQDITGINLDGKMQLNPLKRIKDDALGMKTLTTGAAGVAGGALTAGGNLLHRGANFKKDWKSKGGGAKGFAKTAFGMAGSSIAGAASGFWNASKQAHSSGKFTQGLVKGMEKANTNRTEREIGRENGATTFGIMKAKVQDTLGLPTDYQKSRIDIDNLQNVKKTVDSVNEAAKKEMLIKPNAYLRKEWKDEEKKKKFKAASDRYIAANNRYEALKNVDVNSVKQNAVDTFRTRENQLAEFNSRYGLSIGAGTTEEEIRSQFKSNDEIEAYYKKTIKSGDRRKAAVEKAIQERDSKINLAIKLKDDYVAVSRDAEGNILDENTYARQAENQYYAELENAKDNAFNAGEDAANVYVEMLKDNNEKNITNGAISSQLDVVEKTADKSSAFDKEAKKKYKGNNFAEIKKQAKDDEQRAYDIQSTDKYDKDEASHTAANLGEKSYNNMYNINATKQKKS